MKKIIGKIFFRVSKFLLAGLGFNINLGSSNVQYPELNNDEFKFLQDVYKSSLTMTSFDSLVTLVIACKYVSRSKIPGDFVEAGVWRGGSSIVAKKFLTGNRNFYLYDTYKGMTEPTIHDYRVGSNSNSETLIRWKEQDKNSHNDWVFASLNEVKNNFDQFDLLDSDLVFVEGDVRETLTLENIPKKICVLRLDTDFYDSTLIELQVLWPLLSPGGVLILDDYGHWDGARRAVDEYFELNNENLMVPIAGGGGRIILKR